jgi:hypothetical protein
MTLRFKIPHAIVTSLLVQQWNYVRTSKKDQMVLITMICILWYNFECRVKSLNPICHLLALLGAHHIFHVGRIRVNGTSEYIVRQAAILTKPVDSNNTQMPLAVQIYGAKYRGADKSLARPRGEKKVEKSPRLNWATRFLTVAYDGACLINVSIRMA